MAVQLAPRNEIDQDLLAGFRELADTLSLSCVISDAYDRNGTLHTSIRSRAAERKIIGPATTVRLSAGDIVDCLEVFNHTRAGDVIVIDAFGETETSIWGGLMTGLARNSGVVGAVIDGACRDTDEARLLDFPLFSKAVGPRQSHTAQSGRREPISINQPISCGGVVVTSGDLIIADEIGVVVVPHEHLEHTLERAREIARNEATMRELVLDGATFEELLERFGRI